MPLSLAVHEVQAIVVVAGITVHQSLHLHRWLVLHGSCMEERSRAGKGISAPEAGGTRSAE